MDRELFQIEQVHCEDTGRAWVVVGVLPDSDRYRSGMQAMKRATQLAYRYHLLTGTPTGVKVRLRCGDVVLAAQNG